MDTPEVTTLRETFAKASPSDARFATLAVDHLLDAAVSGRASDVHLQPTSEGFEVRWRVDGVLLPVIVLPASAAPRVVARLKVMAGLLTYRNDMPQEGRLKVGPGEVEMRLSTFPTLYGEKAVVRLFAGSGRYSRLDDLGLPADLATAVRRLLDATSGAIVFSGPAGSGKTTTIYACLRELVAISRGGRSLATLEDPIEVVLPGVSQSQVNPAAGFSLEVGLRSLMRQDPEVIAVGEVRDRETAEVAFQASLTGHLVLTTFHAASAAAAVGRFGDMGIEPYLLRSGLLAIVSQRLARRLCGCAREGDDPDGRLGLAVETFRLPVGCSACGMTGYHGRVVLAEILVTESSKIGRAILSRTDTPRLERLAVEAGMTSLWDRGLASITNGLTSPAEFRRILGVRRESAASLF